MKTIEYPGLSIVTEIPKTLALQSIAVRVIQCSYDNVSSAYPNVDMTLGGVLFIELLQLPPASKAVKGWVMRPATALSRTVQRLSYPLGSHGDSAVPTGSSAAALKVKFQLPAHVVVRDEFPPRLGWWDNSKRCWSEDGIQASPEATRCSPQPMSYSTVTFSADPTPCRTWYLSPRRGSSAFTPFASQQQRCFRAGRKTCLTSTGRSVLRASARQNFCLRALS